MYYVSDKIQTGVKIMYIIYQDLDQSWVLRLRAKRLKKEHKFNKYIDALDAVQLLQLNFNKYDRASRVLRRKI